MGAWFVGNSLWHLVRQADTVTTLVLLILFSMSVICWTVFICKIIIVAFKRRQLRRVAAQVKNVQTLPAILEVASKHKNSVPGYFLSTNLVFLKSLLERQADGLLAPREWEMMQRHIDQTLDTMVAREESYLSLLSTAAAVAPLFGLFGTVWGLVHAFVRISEQQVADIATVAPGIAEALITTLAGLVVAIPALIMFNYLQVQVRVVEERLMMLAHKLSMIGQQVCGRSSYATYDTVTKNQSTAS